MSLTGGRSPILAGVGLAIASALAFGVTLPVLGWAGEPAGDGRRLAMGWMAISWLLGIALVVLLVWAFARGAFWPGSGSAAKGLTER